MSDLYNVQLMGMALFWSAGQMNWWPAWAMLVVTLAWIAATAIVILRFNPDLLVERLGPRKGKKAWDTAIMSVLGIAQLGRFIVARLDRRYGWSGSFSFVAQVCAFLVCVLEYELLV